MSKEVIGFLIFAALMLVWSNLDTNNSKVVLRRCLLMAGVFVTLVISGFSLMLTPYSVLAGMNTGSGEQYAVHEEEEEEQWGPLKLMTLENGDTFGGCLNGLVNLEACEASSYLVAKSAEYPPFNAFDGNKDTCWQEGVDGDGEGETLTVLFTEPIDVHFLSICNGKARSKQDYQKNGRVRYMTIIREDGEEMSMELSDTFEPQYYQVEGMERVSKLTFRIDEVYNGTSFHDTCMSSIAFFE